MLMPRFNRISYGHIESTLGTIHIVEQGRPLDEDILELTIYIDWFDATTVRIVTPDGNDHKVEA